ncbi:MAG: hypothetical protein KAQ65_04825 [Candidatus Thorarchaeota archaeon]|nr:hypothetical protein [Candidatus Thorarchaeota archaeon]MCK5240122.1 hypothetical protein [Candidatus Thorarchaeota archaeon]
MVRNWLTIAKAEFRVMTAIFRRRRRATVIALFFLGILWALFGAPVIMSGFLDIFSVEVQMVFAIAFPGIMRAVILILWIMVLVYPISYALQEIRIGQWEIMLSNNVSTRDMLMGMFLGKVPSYGLLVLILAPVLLSPFMIFYEVSLFGQAVAYLVIAVFAFATLLLSTIISTAIQSKLGDSSRGNDIAKAMGLVVVVVFLVPLYSLMYFAEAFAQLLGLDVFIILPSTWGADLITWTIIYFNGINLPTSSIQNFESILGMGVFTDTFLVGIFVLLVLIIGLAIPDRLFSFEGGARTETVTTVGRDNIILRGIAKALPNSFGVLVITSLKDFGRKAQNVSKVVYAIFIATLLPVMLNLAALGDYGDSEVSIIVMSFLVGMMLSMVCGITFGGIGFLESKDHLWVIKSAPRGVTRFISARVTEAFLLGIPIALTPVIIVSYLLALGPLYFVIMLTHTYLVLCGSILLSVGITSLNPAYENTKSSAFHVNSFGSVIIIMITLILGLIGGINVWLAFTNMFLGLLISSIPLLVLGVSILIIGSMKLASADT